MFPAKESRFLPMPFHSLLLFVVWLLLNNTLAFGHILLALFFAWAIPKLVSMLKHGHPTIKKPWLALRYALLVMKDILVANIEVALIVLGPLNKIHPSFIAIPLDIKSDLGVTLFASTISLTPGTVSTEISEDRKWLYVHALHMDNPEQMIKEAKERYEVPLKEILGC